MKEFWNNRYDNNEYAFGIEPNVFFKQILDNLKSKGKILFPAEGEGRNAVYAAKKGWGVTAFDYSSTGKEKALALASRNNVSIEYLTGELNKLDFKEKSFDVIVLIFVHFPPALRNPYHRRLLKYLKNDGLIILEGFSKEHFELQKLNPMAGGPKNLDMLFSEDEIKSDFSDCDVNQLNNEIIKLDEGIYHKGEASVIRFIGKKQ